MKINITAASWDELDSKASSHYLTIISNQKRGRSFDFEGRTICVLLGCICDVSFPLELVGNLDGVDLERPDFRVLMAGLSVGIEITKAANRDFEWAKNIASHTHSAVVEHSLFAPNIQIKGGPGTKPPVSRTNKPLCGPGWKGYEVEDEWATYVLRSIENKTIKLSEESFGRLDENWLLIHDSTPVRMFLHGDHLEIGMQMLQKKLSHNYWQQPAAFSRVYIECADKMILLEKTAWSKLPLPSWKSVSLTPS